MNKSSRFLILVLVLAACDGSGAGTVADTVVASVSVANAIPKSASPCPATGQWAQCSIEKRLKQSGFVAQKIDSPGKARSGFSVRPIAYTLGRSRLELYLYKDAVALQKEIAKLDTIRVVPMEAAQATGNAPVFIRSENLAALLYTDDATQAERLMLAITAGAPQKPSR